MKSYIRPAFFAEKFTMNEAVSTCGRLPTGDYVYKSTTVECLAQSSDTIFTQGTNGCSHVVDPNASGSDYMFINYNDSDNHPGDGLYFAWRGPVSGSATSELKEVMRSVGITKLTNGHTGWHCGPVNDYLVQIYSHS